MIIHEIDENKFNVKDIHGEITSPSKLRNSFVKYYRYELPKFVNITEQPYTITLSHNNNEISFSVWKFKTNSLDSNHPISKMIYNDNENVIAWNIKIIDKYETLSSDIQFVQYRDSEEDSVMYKIKSARTLGFPKLDLQEFFTNDEDMVNALNEILHSHVSNVKKSKSKFSCNINVRDYDVKINYFNKELTATIPHKYTMQDNVYGAKFQNYCKVIKLNSPEEIRKFDWNSLWDDLYTNRNGKFIRSGGLGT